MASVETITDKATLLRRRLDLVSRDELARALGRSERALKRDWSLRRGPRPILIGQQVFYRVKDVEVYIAELAGEQPRGSSGQRSRSARSMATAR